MRPMHIEFLLLRAHKEHNKVWTTRRKDSKDLLTMPAYAHLGRTQTLTSTVLILQKRMEVIHTIYKPAVGKRIVKTYQVHAWIHDWSRKVTIVNSTANAVKHQTQMTLVVFFSFNTDVKYIDLGAGASQPSGFSIAGTIPASQSSPSSRKHWVISRGRIERMPISTRA